MNEKLQDRRVRKTRKQLRKALIHLMQEKPVKSITVREISELADINRATFYLHYRDVFDMVEQVETDMFDEFNNIIRINSPDKSVGNPFPLLTDIFSYLAENADLCMALLGENGDITFINRLKQLVKEKSFADWEALYKDGKTDNFEHFYAFVISGCIGLLENWLKSGMKESPTEIASLANRMIMHGIAVLTPAAE